MTEFQSIFDQLVSERGGKAALGIVGMSIARALAAALVDPATSPSTIANLSASLPPKMQSGEKPLDLRELTNRELRELEYLVRRASGEQVARPPRIRRSRREEHGLELAQYLDGLARRGVGIGHRDRTPPTADEQNSIRNFIHFVLGDVADVNRLYSYLASGNRPAPPAAVAAPAAVVEPEATPSAPTADNVVNLTPSPRRSVHDGQKLADHSESWRGAILPNLT